MCSPARNELIVMLATPFPSIKAEPKERRPIVNTDDSCWHSVRGSHGCDQSYRVPNCRRVVRGAQRNQRVVARNEGQSGEVFVAVWTAANCPDQSQRAEVAAGKASKDALRDHYYLFDATPGGQHRRA